MKFYHFIVAALIVMAAESNARTVDEYTYSNGGDIVAFQTSMHEKLFMQLIGSDAFKCYNYVLIVFWNAIDFIKYIP